jgi:membrane protein YdbS with pleckstrin-like domain
MLTQEEKGFVEYWGQNRLNKKKVLYFLYAGLPLAVALIASVFVTTFTGWYERADMELQKNLKSLIIVLFIAALLIVAFIVIFSARHRWDINEQRYRELLAKDKRD